MPPGRYAVTDAGSLLLGGMTQTLGAFLQERRARQEREDVRSEAKRRYEEQRQFLMARAGQESTERLLAMEPRAGLAALPQVESYLAKIGQPPMGAGTMRPTTGQVPAAGPPAPMLPPAPGPFATREGPLPVGQQAEVWERPLPVGTEFQAPTMTQEQPPTHPVAADFYERMRREEGLEETARLRDQGKVAIGAVGDVLNYDPTGEGTRLLYEMATAGAPPPPEEAVTAAAARGRQFKGLIDVERARRRSAGAGRAPKAGPLSKFVQGYIRPGNLEGAFKALPHYFPEMANASAEDQRRFVLRMREQFVTEREALALAAAGSREVQAINERIRAVEATRDKKLKLAMETNWGPKAIAKAVADINAESEPALERLRETRDGVARKVLPGLAVSGPTAQAEPSPPPTPDAKRVAEGLRIVLSLSEEERRPALESIKKKGVAIPPEVMAAKDPKALDSAIRLALTRLARVDEEGIALPGAR